MSLYNYEKPWLLNLKSFTFIALGLFALVQIKNTLPILLFILVALLIFNVIIRFADVFIIKSEKNKTPNLIVGIISLVFVIWFTLTFNNFDFSAQAIEASRHSSYIVIITWMAFTALASLYEAITLFVKKNKAAHVYLIDFLLLALMAYLFFAVVTEAADISKALRIFGLYCICVGIVSLSLSKLVIAVSDKQE